jgi:hypothetical protein
MLQSAACFFKVCISIVLIALLCQLPAAFGVGAVSAVCLELIGV